MSYIYKQPLINRKKTMHWFFFSKVLCILPMAISSSLGVLKQNDYSTAEKEVVNYETLGSLFCQF